MSDRVPPEQRSDGQGPHPPVLDMFVKKDDFYAYVLDNRDRQDKNKTEIIDAVDTAVMRSAEACQDDVDDLSGRVTKLEDGSRQQTLTAALIASATAIITGIVTGIGAYFARGGN